MTTTINKLTSPETTTQTPESVVDTSVKGNVEQVLAATSRNLNYKKLGDHLTAEIKEYVESRGIKSMVMGVSGGVDSGLVSTLAARTGLPLMVVEMPIHQAEDQVDRAQEHIAWLKENFDNVTSERIDLTETFETIQNAFPEIKNEAVGMALVNTRSRLRGVALYAMANDNGGIVLGTGNKVEDYGIAFFTKFGDGAVDISPIGELLKSEVRALARELGVSPNISEAIATDGLHTDGATDEDQIGCSYDELEWAMEQYDAGKRTADFEGRGEEVMTIYTARHQGGKHKMEMPPVFSLGQ